MIGVRGQTTAGLTDRDLRNLREHLRQIMSQSGTLSPLPIAQKAERLARAAQDKAYFLQTYCPHYFPHPFSNNHIRALEHCDTRNILYLLTAHRNWGKTAIGTFGDQLDKIYHEKRRFFLIVSNTVEMAEPFVAALKLEIEENPRLKQDFGDLVGARLWTSREFVTRNDRKILARGILQPFRGLRHGPYRPDDVTFDDVENDQTADSSDQCKKIQRRIWKAVRPALQRQKDGGWGMKWVGTPISTRSITYQFMRDESRAMIKDIIPLVDEAGQSTWPEVYDQKEIANLAADDQEAWWSEYMLSPMSDEEQVFRGRIQYIKENELPSFGPGDVTYGAVDPSFGHENDFKAVVTLTGQRQSMKIFCRHAYIRKGPVYGTPRAMCQAITEQQNLYNADYAVEDNSLKDFLWEAVGNYEKDSGTHLRVHGVTHGSEASKQKRILRLLSPMERQKVYFIKGHSDQDRLVEQFEQFPKGHDDGPDAFEEAYQQVLKRLQGGSLTNRLQTGGHRAAASELKMSRLEMGGW